MKENYMRNIVLLALMDGVLMGCVATPTNEAEYAAMWNADRRTWPPVVPGTAFPPQHMDGGRN